MNNQSNNFKLHYTEEVKSILQDHNSLFSRKIKCWFNNKILAIFLMVLFGLTTGSIHAQAKSFQFGIVGDTPLSKKQEKEFSRVITELNQADLSFVIHIGDFEADPRGMAKAPPGTVSVPCTDENYGLVKNLFMSSKHPFILTPGDNEWADCILLKEPKVDPLERLEKIRTMFFPEGKSLGQNTMAVESQSNDPKYRKFRENLRWSISDVTFATMHIIGSNDNYGRSEKLDAEQKERSAASIAWMKEAFAKAKTDSSLGLVLMTQANVRFESQWTSSLIRRYLTVLGIKPPKELKPNSYAAFLTALAEEVENYDKPITFIHGDTHIFRISQPLLSQKTKQIFENFTRVETFGSPSSHWVSVTVDPEDPQLFSYRHQIVEANIVNRLKK